MFRVWSNKAGGGEVNWAWVWAGDGVSPGLYLKQNLPSLFVWGHSLSLSAVFMTQRTHGPGQESPMLWSQPAQLSPSNYDIRWHIPSIGTFKLGKCSTCCVISYVPGQEYRNVWNLKKRTGHAIFMLSLFPRLLKFRTAPLPLPYQDISESESDTESRGVGSGSGDEMLTLETRGTELWAVRGNVRRYRDHEDIGLRVRICRVPGVSLSVVTKLWSPDDCLRHYGHYGHYDPWHQPAIITPSQAYNHRTSDTSPPPISSHSLLKNIQNFTKHDILSQPAGGTEAFVRSL